MKARSGDRQDASPVPIPEASNAPRASNLEQRALLRRQSVDVRAHPLELASRDLLLGVDGVIVLIGVVMEEAEVLDPSPVRQLDHLADA